jgi:anti-anti-sigma factor
MNVIEAAGLNIEVQETSMGEVLILEGEVDTANCGALIAGLDLASATLPALLVVDATRLSFIASCGVRAIAATAERTSHYGDLQVKGARPNISRTFEVTGNRSLIAAGANAG